LDAIGEEAQIGGRPREYRNIPLSQYGWTGISNQAAFQFKGSMLLARDPKSGHHFSEKSSVKTRF
jgi:hypothetical protein